MVFFVVNQRRPGLGLILPDLGLRDKRDEGLVLEDEVLGEVRGDFEGPDEFEDRLDDEEGGLVVLVILEKKSGVGPSAKSSLPHSDNIRGS